MTGRAEGGAIVTVQVAAPGSRSANPAFDVTPARLVTGIITERGLARACRGGPAGALSGEEGGVIRPAAMVTVRASPPLARPGQGEGAALRLVDAA